MTEKLKSNLYLGPVNIYLILTLVSAAVKGVWILTLRAYPDEVNKKW